VKHNDDEKSWSRRARRAWRNGRPAVLTRLRREAAAKILRLDSVKGDRTGRDCVSVMRGIRWSGAALTVVLIVRGTIAADRPLHEIQVTARRYGFDPVTIQVNAGEPVRIVIRSKDGVHGFAIPTLKIDAQVPKSGDPVTVEFTAPPAGRYEIACSEFCGSGHSQMKGALISIEPTRTSR